MSDGLVVFGVTDGNPDHQTLSPWDGGLPVIRRIRNLESLVDGLMAEWVRGHGLIHGRKSHRVVARQFFGLTPLCDDTFRPIGESYRVQAFDLSPHGLSFMHQQTLPYRMVAATFQLADGALESVVTRLKWCRFTRKHHYRSGGQFLRMIRLGWEAETGLDALPAG